MTFEYLPLLLIAPALLNLRRFEASDAVAARVVVHVERDLWEILRRSPIAGGWVQ